jgi:hypothetical protein
MIKIIVDSGLASGIDYGAQYTAFTCATSTLALQSVRLIKTILLRSKMKKFIKLEELFTFLKNPNMENPGDMTQFCPGCSPGLPLAKVNSIAPEMIWGRQGPNRE